MPPHADRLSVPTSKPIAPRVRGPPREMRGVVSAECTRSFTKVKVPQ